MQRNKFLILGVTASGKSRLGFELANLLGGEILSIDSMKIYRRMDIGTAKPPKKLTEQIKYHMIDIVEPSETFNVGAYLEMAEDVVEDILSRGKPVVAVGGTALYIKAMLYGLFNGPGSDEQIRSSLKQRAEEEGLANLHKQLAAIDPQAAERIHPNDKKRIIRALEVYQLTGKPISYFQKQFDQPPRTDWTVIGLRRPKEVESHRINMRVKMMIESGLVDEVGALLAEEKPLSKQAAYAIGYAEIIDHLKNKTSLGDAIEKIKVNTRKLAKSQRTWFKTFSSINWIEIDEETTPEQIFEQAMKIIKT
ncbi:MAG: tRNA (adenosine(37)-N6)-dimethylallyltransferase MiaA [Phycisphaerae bacterium]|nr:tRNA (adenosine(37)-N6)-dimethylallyltransferase MiaA [Phycisphaerae bacterium]